VHNIKSNVAKRRDKIRYDNFINAQQMTTKVGQWD
jgi:hypothetical protein